MNSYWIAVVHLQKIFTYLFYISTPYVVKLVQVMLQVDNGSQVFACQNQYKVYAFAPTFYAVAYWKECSCASGLNFSPMTFGDAIVK